jgi:hypothetical protein
VNLRELVEAVSWQVRGPFAVSPLREIGFAARGAFQLAEMRARRELARQLPQQDLAIDRERGYVRMPADARFEELAATGSSIAGVNAGRNMGGKEFFRARFSTDDEVAILLRAALDTRIVAAVASYLGTVPVICEADYYCSIPHGPPWSKSQLWHCDDDSARIVKLFVYCEPVGADNGPFELVDARRSRDARRAVGYRYAGRRYRVSDAAMNAHVPLGEQHAFDGPRSSGFLIDTSRCFHRGSRILAKENRRVAAIVTYVQPNARKLPLRLRDGNAPLARFASRFADPIERAVLGVPVA